MLINIFFMLSSYTCRVLRGLYGAKTHRVYKTDNNLVHSAPLTIRTIWVTDTKLRPFLIYFHVRSIS